MARSHVFHNGESICVEVVLSRRNLLALLHKLDMEDSARTIINNDSYVTGQRSTHLLILKCEDDDEHYSKRECGPGMMVSETEAFVAKEGGTPGTVIVPLRLDPDSAPT